MKSLLTLIGLLFCMTAFAETTVVFHQLPTPVEIEGHQCGYTPVEYRTTGFDQSGNHVVSEVYATTTCQTGKVGTSPSATYSGCAQATWDLFGNMTLVHVTCGTVQVYSAPQGYSIIFEPLTIYEWGYAFKAPYPTPVLIIK